MKMQLWKKALAAVTAGVLCLGSVGISGVQSVLESVRTVLTASADVPGEYDGTYGDLYYKNDDDLVSIVGCKTTAESVEIPAEELQELTTVGAVIDYLKNKGVEE